MADLRALRKKCHAKKLGVKGVLLTRTEQDTIDLLNKPIVWLSQAESLYDSMKVLERSLLRRMNNTDIESVPKWVNIGYGYMLLAGFVLENLAKGIIFAKNPIDNKNDEHLKGHDLPGLLGKAGLAFDNPDSEKYEQNLSERLEVIITWGGKYPLPKPNVKSHQAPGWFECDLVFINKWIDILHSKLQDAIRTKQTTA